jgi:preprotein translocase SecF subunit
MKPIRWIKQNTNINFLGFRKISIFFSFLLCICSIFSIFIFSLNYGIDFKGGTLIEIKSSSKIEISNIRSRLYGIGFEDAQIQTFGSDDTILIRIENDNAVDGKADLNASKIIAKELGNLFLIQRTEIVGPKVSSELIQKGVLAIITAVSLMLFYIWIRFEWQFSLGAVLALIHDVLITIGLFSFFGIDFNLSIIAALLTIIGYSMNDTVVVYDRIRENLRKYKQMDLFELINNSINDTLSRTTLTSVTTLLALFSLYFLGGEVIRGFTLAMIIGVFIGTYSSIFIASQIILFLGIKRDWSKN